MPVCVQFFKTESFRNSRCTLSCPVVFLEELICLSDPVYCKLETVDKGKSLNLSRPAFLSVE